MPPHFRQFLHAVKARLHENSRSSQFSSINSLHVGSGFKEAAVLLPLCLHDGVPSILFTKRSNSMRNHSGQVSFPGGMRDEADVDEVATVLRELFEEVNVESKDVEILGVLPNHVASGGSKTLVTPIVGCFNRDLSHLNIKANPSEVDSVFSLPVHYLLNIEHRDIYRSHPRFLHPTSPDYHIWGFTGFVLHYFLHKIHDIPCN